jgi:hypothetical protein
MTREARDYAVAAEPAAEKRRQALQLLQPLEPAPEPCGPDIRALAASCASLRQEMPHPRAVRLILVLAGTVDLGPPALALGLKDLATMEAPFLHRREI